MDHLTESEQMFLQEVAKHGQEKVIATLDTEESK